MNEDQVTAGDQADALIEVEVAIQDSMWGDANERADSTNNQLLDAALSQIVVTKSLLEGVPTEEAVEIGMGFYPTGWTGLRSYGSTVANLVVAAAFIRSEIKRRVMAGEDTTRTKRDEPYKGAAPYMSAEVARAKLNEGRGPLIDPTTD
jgi:hypothetical protein